MRKSKKERSFYVNHLVVNKPGVFIGKSGEQVIVKEKNKALYEIPVIQLKSLTLSSHSTSVSSDLIQLCAQKNIPLFWISKTGEIDAYIQKPGAFSIEIQIQQLKLYENYSKRFELSKAVLLGKMKNQISLIKYFGKYNKNKNRQFENYYSKFNRLTNNQITNMKTLKPLNNWGKTRGRLYSIEGQLAMSYWKMYGILLKDIVPFHGRFRQGASDLVNMILNYGYAILRTKVLIELYRLQLNPYIGFLHASQKNKPALVFDFMEVFRSQIVDRVILTQLRRNRQHFKTDKEGALTLSSREKIISLINTRFDATESSGSKQIKLQDILYQQTCDLKKAITGNHKYKPFIARW